MSNYCRDSALQRPSSLEPWIQRRAFEADTFLAEISHRMAELYSVALSLPSVEPESSGTNEPTLRADKSAELYRPQRIDRDPPSIYRMKSSARLSGNGVYRDLSAFSLRLPL